MTPDAVTHRRFVGERAEPGRVEPDAHEQTAALRFRLRLMRGAPVHDRVVVAELRVARAESELEACLPRDLVDEIEQRFLVGGEAPPGPLRRGFDPVAVVPRRHRSSRPAEQRHAIFRRRRFVRAVLLHAVPDETPPRRRHPFRAGGEEGVVNRHRTRDAARRVVGHLSHAQQGNRVGEVDMQRRLAREADRPRPLVRAQRSLGDIVDQPAVAVLAHRRPEMGAEAPEHDFDFVESVTFDGETAQQREPAPVAQYAPDTRGDGRQARQRKRRGVDIRETGPGFARRRHRRAQFVAPRIVEDELPRAVAFEIGAAPHARPADGRVFRSVVHCRHIGSFSLSTNASCAASSAAPGMCGRGARISASTAGPGAVALCPGRVRDGCRPPMSST